jgi:ABC-2 type transport system permease protein
MNGPPPLPVPKPAPPPEVVLRRLFLALFLRGRSSRGLQKEKTPKSIGSKLAFTLVVYALVGLVGLMFYGQPVFGLSLYLHAMTLVFLGMFVASSAGEVLFNKEEADILMHRPVTPQSLLWAKIAVLVQVSFWLAGAFNLVGFFVGLSATDGGWLFPIVHAISTALQALFCTGCVVLIYQLCLRWFGRERLEGLMTTAQVFMAVGTVLAGQLVPQLIGRFGKEIRPTADIWWIAFLPPAWFAALDDTLVAGGTPASWGLAGVGLAATGLVLWLAFGKLAQNYHAGLQSLNESSTVKPQAKARRRWLDHLVSVPPLKWWLRDSVVRASFLLTAAYLMRDREVKLRVYPGLAPMLVMPLIFLIQGRGGTGGFGISFSGAYLGLVPLLALTLIQYSQQWQAADLFRAAPISGPVPLCDGARRAVLCFLALPALLLMAGLAAAVPKESSSLLLLLPGLIATPLYALYPILGGKSVPLSMPVEEAKSAQGGLKMIGVTMVSIALAGITAWAWASGWFWWFILGETILAAILYTAMRASLKNVLWEPID